MSINLSEILGLVGPLDDAPGDQTPRERFRRYLKDKVKEIGTVRDYVEECLQTSGGQYNRALQDLVNYIGQFLGFEINFGRYRGVQDEIGFDGHWRSPTGFHVVVEVKTGEVFPVKTAILMGYVNELISAKKIPDWTSALGLYVIGRPDRELRQLDNAIVAENNTDRLRIVSVESLLSLAELMSSYGLSHQNVLALVRPSGPRVDAVIDLIAQLAGPEPPPEETASQPRTFVAPPIQEPTPAKTNDQEPQPSYWLTSVKSDDQETAEEIINRLVGEAKVYHFGLRALGMRLMKPGDWVCFYAAGKGVVAHAAIVSAPTQEQDTLARDFENFPWLVRLDSPVLYLDRPVVLNAKTRRRLDAFKGGDLEKGWGLFVHGTRKLTRHDYEELTRQPISPT